MKRVGEYMTDDDIVALFGMALVPERQEFFALVLDANRRAKPILMVVRDVPADQTANVISVCVDMSAPGDLIAYTRSYDGVLDPDIRIVTRDAWVPDTKEN